MRRHGWHFGGVAIVMTVLCATASIASAQTETQTTETTTTTATPPPPAPVIAQPAPQPVVVQPAAPAAPVKQKQVVTDTHSHNYMATIAESVFFGALAGALVGTAVYIVDHENHARNIAYWGAGGAIVGGTIGIVQVAVDENRTERAVSGVEPSMERKNARERGFAFMPRVVNVSF
jgi:hypothetical protein